MSKKIVIVTYGGGHVAVMVPIIKQLQKNKGLELVVLGLTTAGLVLKKNSIPYIGFKNLLEVDKSQHAIKWGKKLVDSSATHKAVSYDESVAYMGLSYIDLELRHGIDDAARIYKTQGGRQAFYPLSVMERLLKTEKPDLVVATSAPRAEKAAIIMAGKLNIPSVCIVDLFAKQEIAWVGEPGYADKVCVLSEFVKNTLMRAGRNDEDIIVTGNPAFDGLIKYKDQTDRLRKKRGIAKETKVILWVSQSEPRLDPLTGEAGDPTLPRKIDKALLKAVANHPDWQLVIRPHPSENLNYNRLPDNVRISGSNDNLHELLSTVDVVVTMSSTVGLEAAILKKPVITVDLSILNIYIPYSKMNISRGINNLNDLEYVLAQELKNNRENMVTLPHIGSATSNVISVINGIIRYSDEPVRTK